LFAARPCVMPAPSPPFMCLLEIAPALSSCFAVFTFETVLPFSHLKPFYRSLQRTARASLSSISALLGKRIPLPRSRAAMFSNQTFNPHVIHSQAKACSLVG
jgi:hypothetical protein